MYERFLAYIAIAIIQHLEERAYRRSTAVDATRADRDLDLAGDRIGRWMRENGPRTGGQSGEDRPGVQDQGVHPAG